MIAILEELQIDFILITLLALLFGVVNFCVEFHAWKQTQAKKRAKIQSNVIYLRRTKKNDFRQYSQL